MASVPDGEQRALRERVAVLEADLGACRGQLERVQRRLRRTERLYRQARQGSEALRRQVEELTKEIRNTKEKDACSVEVQTEHYAPWSQADYYYYENYYNHTDTQDCASELPLQHNHETEGTEHNSPEELQTNVDTPLRMDGTKVAEGAEEENLIQSSQEVEDTTVQKGSLAETLRAAAEAAVSQTGFIYDENTGLYYDHSTGFYYNSENQLYYDPATGIYYYCDVESGRYQFHSRVDLQSYQASGIQHTKDKKGKKKRKEPERITANEYKVRQLAETMANLKISSFGLATSGEDEEKIWPPCIRVIVIRSPVLQTGSLYIITAVKPATIGREKDVGHTLQIPEVGVSKFHAEVYFDHDLQNYVLVDQGSQNGTVVNGNQILQPKTKCDPYILEHGDEVKIGETVLSFHIHPGSDTCDGCEPGQVRAHLRLDRKKESSVCPALSKEERELVRRKALKQIRVKYGLQNTEYEDNKAVKNPKYKDRAGKRRETIGSEGTFQRDDSPASVHIEISNSNKGHKMLEKMGWKKGEGLGKDGGGMKDPIYLQLHKTHAGLGTSRPASIEDVQIIQSKNKKNWDKARERFAENFQEPTSQRESPKITSWVKGTVE
ncbi:angiogenic factor with G patch and FHA domains 1 isoform X2 [Falco biarmicus]|uniref:angiogenic factor with G patch and FHA domains 1 isoform X2 n=1 Tax=Falco rusticolus TaxID=120794 RepID=UPI0018869546|nr:angiogenic factor with G patch and FHA domains 1 isoform X2 [Falco rusticolus]XP_055554779.1 angiogenic factor with G patch and FHA domains 1 isoform X2 [Falco cherrug]XP_055646625.1 angiogenic factor with G patch and FHA domains 1 isoform X2 [Falco peregrinus]XP_056180304.1 angiogenic factor with G patch and FHA domains 1 isoform X2 [Falco biarmicus]